MSQSELLSVCLFLAFWWFVYTLEIRYIVSWVRRRIFPRSGTAVAVHVLAVTGLFLLAYGYFIEPYWLDVRPVIVQSSKVTSSSLTLVQISDLHCETETGNEEHLVRLINGIESDVIVFTGDALNTRAALPTFKKTLASLRAPLGKFAVRGNFDVWRPKDPDLFKETGFRELDGATAVLNKSGLRFSITGFSVDNTFRDLSFLDDLQSEDYNILLFHYPGIHERFPDLPVDLYLSGHTHGGQVALPFYGALVTLAPFGKKYEVGRYDVDGKVVYVNRGIGMEGGIAPRVRLGARPEITVFHIEPDNPRWIRPFHDGGTYEK